MRYDTRCYFDVRSKADTSQLIAKFHYTDPTRTRTRTKSVHVVGYELNSTTRTRHGPDTDPTGPARTPTDFFAAKLRWVRAGPVGSV